MERGVVWGVDWRLAILVYIVCSGVWGVLAKFASARLEALTQSFIGVGCAWLVIAAAGWHKLRWESASGVLAAALGGILGGVASVAFYAALRQAPVSIVLPLSSLYLVLTVVLACAFLGEVVGPRQLAGIVLGLAAMWLLAR